MGFKVRKQNKIINFFFIKVIKCTMIILFRKVIWVYGYFVH